MKKLQLAFLSIILLLSVNCLQAQEKDDSTSIKLDSVHEKPAKSYFQVGVSYLSDNVYFGRKDSVKIPYISPTIGYYAKSGFYLNGSFSYIPTTGENRIDAIILETGWDFNIGDFDGEVNASKNFYSSNSTNVKSEIVGSLSATAGYDFGFIKPSAQGTMDFGTKFTDYSLTLGLEHTFEVVQDIFQFTPSFFLNESTQNYYGSYYSKRRYTKRKTKAGIPITYQVTADLADVSKFKPMDYEFTMPIEYTTKKFTFNFTPSYTIPVNPNTVTLVLTPNTGPTVSKTFTETLSNSFFFSLGITCKF